ncbi:MAG: PASTA domain-containing protein [Oscillospiraceae bacterium]|nr:PASTA domain-containing protein [Oscillospiraceae bacterium]
MSDCIFCERQLNNEDKCVWCGFPQQAREPISGTLSYGTKIKDYVIGNVLSVDGESTTYLAFDKTIQQKVIVKEFLPVTLVAPRNGAEVAVQPAKQVLFKNLLYDFVDMYQTLQKIKSPAMPKIHEVFIENKTAYAVLDYVKGMPLKDYLISRGKPFTFKEARWMFEAVFNLLDEMSKMNIHHGGISDETVIVTPDGSVVLTGFAIQDLRTKNDHVAYKLYQGFSAPEQYYSDGFQGMYTDIYALASLMYYTVTGKILEKAALESKDIYRIFPKYAVEALKYATKSNFKERIDSIEDFVMMLDDKGTVIKPQTKQEDKKDSKKLVQYGIIAAALIVVLVLAFSIIGGNSEPAGSESNPVESSQPVQETRLPNFVGYAYSDVIADSSFQKDYTFVKLEAYSSEYSKGRICKQSPEVGTAIAPGTTVYLTVSLGPQSVKVPDIIGISYDDAVEKLDRLGIAYRKEYVDQTRKYVAGMVADLSIDEGEEIMVNDEVLVVYVANDKPLATPTPEPTPTPTPTPEPTPEPEATEEPSGDE